MWGHQPERNAPCHGCQERKGFPEGYNTQQSVLHFWPVIGACPACIVNFIKAHRCALHWHTRTYICPHVCLLNLHTWVTHWSYLESACSQAHVFAHTYTPSPPPTPPTLLPMKKMKWWFQAVQKRFLLHVDCRGTEVKLVVVCTYALVGQAFWIFMHIIGEKNGGPQTIPMFWS